MTKYRLQFEKGWKKERVWCVTTTSGNIITRRKGTVTITGNTEGFDAPSTKIVVMGRPTKSKLLYQQMLGRGTRALPGTVDGLDSIEARKDAIAASGKPFATVLDFVGNTKHSVVTATDVLGGNFDIDILDSADELLEVAEKGANVRDAINKARAGLLFEEDEKKRKPVRDVIASTEVGYTLSDVDMYTGGIHSNKSSTQTSRGGSTDAQVAALVNLGISKNTALSFKRKQAGAVIDKLRKERCTEPQARTLKRYKLDPLKFNADTASKQIDVIAKNGWRLP